MMGVNVNSGVLISPLLFPRGIQGSDLESSVTEYKRRIQGGMNECVSVHLVLTL